MNYGRAIRILRAARDVSQTDLAAKCDLSPSTVSLIEAGKREPSTESLRAIIDVLRTDAIVLHALAGAGLSSAGVPDAGIAVYVLRELLWEPPASDPITTAVDAQLDPLRAQLVDAGHKLAGDGDDALIDEAWQKFKAADEAAKGSPRDIIRTALDPWQRAKDGDA